jgi:hypothetical protein
MIQHLVSRGMLRRFSNHRRGPISGLDLDTLQQRIDKVERFGAIDSPDLAEPDGIENVWNQEVETRLPYAFQLLDEGKLLSNETAVTTIKNCIILHWARGFALREITDRLLPAKADEVTASVLERFAPTDALHALTGLHVVSPDATRLLQQRIRNQFAEKMRKERFVDQQFLKQYRDGQRLIRPYSLEIWRSQTEEFLIGDAPAVSYDKDTDQVGVLNGVSWDKADCIFMPLGPHHVVALSKESRYKEADAAMVERLNVWQVRGALREVYYRPESGLGDIIANALKQNQAAD